MSDLSDRRRPVGVKGQYIQKERILRVLYGNTVFLKNKNKINIGSKINPKIHLIAGNYERRLLKHVDAGNVNGGFWNKLNFRRRERRLLDNSIAVVHNGGF